MLGIEAHQFASGRFYATAIKLSSLGVVSATSRKRQTYCSKNFRKNCLGNYKVSLIFGFVFLCSLYFSSIGLLRLSGDVESNSGPTYFIEKVIQGSLHHGNPRFGRTAGVQCACNSLFALCWSQVETVSRWNKSDLNHVLTEGDLLYKSLNVVDMLTADDLPRSIVMCNIEFPVDFLELKTEIAHLRNGESFLRRSVPNTGDEFMFLLFMGGFTTALMKHHNHFYLFDSHSRDSRGLSVVDGTSVLMKVSDLFEVENHIQAYLECDSMEQSYFQLQFIHFSICRELQLDILSCAKRVRRRLTYQEKSTNLQSKRKETPAKVSMKNDLSKIELEFAASSTSQERMLREDNFASSENLKQVTFSKIDKRGTIFHLCDF